MGLILRRGSNQLICGMAHPRQPFSVCGVAYATRPLKKQPLVSLRATVSYMPTRGWRQDDLHDTGAMEGGKYISGQNLVFSRFPVREPVRDAGLLCAHGRRQVPTIPFLYAAY